MAAISWLELAVGEVVQAGTGLRPVPAGETRLVHQPPFTALRRVLALDLVDRLADGDHHQQSPEVIPVGESGIPAVAAPR